MADAPGEAILPADLKDGYSTGGTVRLHRWQRVNAELLNFLEAE